MKKFFKTFLLMALFLSPLMAENLTLEDCFRLAQKNHPVMKQKQPINQITEKELKNINTRWLPELNLTMNAGYQSDVTNIDITLPPAMAGFSIPEPDKDMIKSELEISQMIYDGGLVAVQKELAMQDNKISLQKINTNFQDLKLAISEFYYNLLLLKKQKALLKSRQIDLEQSLTVMQNLVKSGVKESTDRYELAIKLHELRQTIAENSINMQNSRKILSQLIGQDINRDIVLFEPEITGDTTSFFNAQSRLFDYQQQRLKIAEKINFRNRLPKLRGFGKIGYGKPGLNMLSDEFDSYYQVGLILQWNIWDWQFNQRERQKLQYNRKLLEYSEAAYNQNLSIELDKLRAEIANLRQKIAKEREIFELHQKIRESADAKLQQGTINTTDYLIYDNNYARAELNMEIHKVRLYKTKVKYLIQKGEL
ncbi:MAG: TolC family protein [Fidelibacterota bacterium]